MTRLKDNSKYDENGAYLKTKKRSKTMQDILKEWQQEFPALTKFSRRQLCQRVGPFLIGLFFYRDIEEYSRMYVDTDGKEGSIYWKYKIFYTITPLWISNNTNTNWNEYMEIIIWNSSFRASLNDFEKEVELVQNKYGNILNHKIGLNIFIKKLEEEYKYNYKYYEFNRNEKLGNSKFLSNIIKLLEIELALATYIGNEELTKNIWHKIDRISQNYSLDDILFENITLNAWLDGLRSIVGNREELLKCVDESCKLPQIARLKEGEFIGDFEFVHDISSQRADDNKVLYSNINYNLIKIKIDEPSPLTFNKIVDDWNMEFHILSRYSKSKLYLRVDPFMLGLSIEKCFTRYVGPGYYISLDVVPLWITNDKYFGKFYYSCFIKTIEYSEHLCNFTSIVERVKSKYGSILNHNVVLLDIAKMLEAGKDNLYTLNRRKRVHSKSFIGISQLLELELALAIYTGNDRWRNVIWREIKTSIIPYCTTNEPLAEGLTLEGWLNKLHSVLDNKDELMLCVEKNCLRHKVSNLHVCEFTGIENFKKDFPAKGNGFTKLKNKITSILKK